jgi:hypothetical protein
MSAIADRDEARQLDAVAVTLLQRGDADAAALRE